MGTNLVTYVWIAVGSAFGGTSRFWLSGVIARMFGETFPWGTLIVNVSGSLLIGVIAALTGPDGRIFVSSTTRLALMAGFCGGYTTFSSFSLQTLSLAQDGDWIGAGANIVLSVALCLAAVWAGYAAAMSLNAMKWI
jgi:CrcB protein